MGTVTESKKRYQQVQSRVDKQQQLNESDWELAELGILGELGTGTKAKVQRSLNAD